MSLMNKAKIFLVIFAFLNIAMQANLSRSKSTAHFRMQYEKGVTDADIRLIGENLESAYVKYSKLFGISFKRPADVHVFRTLGRYRMESQSPVFDDGSYRSGRLYLMVTANEEDIEAKKYSTARVVSRAILEHIPSCPEWLKVGYSLVAGRDLERFGPPVRVNVAQFSDLGEDYNRGVSKKDVKELYAKIAATVQFFIGRYGEHAVVQMFQKFKTEDSLSEVLESSVNEKMELIEEAWVKHLESAEQRR